MTALAIIGNPRGDGLSESEAWKTSERSAQALIQLLETLQYRAGLSSSDRARIGEAMGTVHELRLLARAMRQQVDRGVHVNPRRNPAGQVMSENVQAIVYRHEKDGECYIHAFGNGKVTKSDLALLSRMSCLKDRTQVQMIAEPDGSVSVVGANGQPLWKEF